MTIETGLVLLVLGIAVLLFGNRLWMLGAGAGALLGYALTEFFPELFGGTLQLVAIAGLAVALAVLALFGKAFLSLIAMGVGFVVGGGLTLSVLGAFGMTTSWLVWVAAVVVGVIVAGLFGRFLDWSLVIFASLLGALLIARGAASFFPDLVTEAVSTGIIVVLTGLGIFYHYRRGDTK